MSVSPKNHSQAKSWTLVKSVTEGCVGLVATLLVSAAAIAASGQPADAPVTPNYKDVDFTVIAQAVSAATGKNFIIDPRVHAKVTMISRTPMSSAAFYEAFLSIVSVHGWVAKDYGNVVTISAQPGTVGPSKGALITKATPT